MVYRGTPPVKKNPNALTTTDILYAIGILQFDSQHDLGIATKDDMIYIGSIMHRLTEFFDVEVLKTKLRKDLDMVNRLIIIQSELAKKKAEEPAQEKPKRGRKKKS